MQWFDRKFDNEVNSYLLHEKLEKRLLKLGAPDLYNMREGRDALRVHLIYIEKLLQARDWLAGRRLSVRGANTHRRNARRPMPEKSSSLRRRFTTPASLSVSQVPQRSRSRSRCRAK